MFLAYLILSLFCAFIIFRPGRVFDFLSVGFLSQQLYFSPLLFQAFSLCGVQGCYSYLTAVVGMMLVGVLTSFSLLPLPSRGKLISVSPQPEEKVFLLICLSAAVGAFLFLVAKSAGQIFFLPKRDMMRFISYDYIVWTFSSSIGAIYSFKAGRNKAGFLFLFILSISIYIGFRSATAITVIAIFISLSTDFKLSVSSLKAKYVIGISLVGFVFFVYKGFYSAIKLMNYDLFWSRVFDVNYYASIFQSSEPVMTLSILSNVLESDLYIGPSDLIRSGAVFTVFIEGLFKGLKSFNDIIQPLFYSDRAGGVGSNIWAHWFAMTGWLGLIVFSIFYGFSLWVLSYLQKNSQPYLATIFSLTGAYWAFYIHRNDFVYQLTLEKRAVLIFIFLYGVSLIASLVLFKRIRRGW